MKAKLVNQVHNLNLSCSCQIRFFTELVIFAIIMNKHIGELYLYYTLMLLLGNIQYIQSQSEEFRPRSESLTPSLVGTIVLNLT